MVQNRGSHQCHIGSQLQKGSLLPEGVRIGLKTAKMDLVEKSDKLIRDVQNNAFWSQHQPVAYVLGLGKLTIMAEA